MQLIIEIQVIPLGLLLRLIIFQQHGNPLQYYCLENPMDRGAW